jgi:hypothetical protein
MSMPRVVNLPDPEDFCRYDYEDGEQCCFMGWQNKLFPKMDFVEECKFDRTAVAVAKKMRLKKNNRPVAMVANYNDCYENSDRRLATWFRKTVEQLGYDVK